MAAALVMVVFPALVTLPHSLFALSVRQRRICHQQEDAVS